MKRFAISLTPVFAALLACLLFTECRKKDDGPSETRKQLPGSWRVTAFGADMNGNTLLDLDEFVPAPETPAIVNTFSADGTGSTSMSYNGFPLNTTNTWELSNSDKTLKVVANTNGVGITQYYTIVSINSVMMVLADTTRAQRSFTVANKQ